jgi:hypothetical protein
MTGKKHGGVMKNSRTQDWFQRVSAVLTECGAEWWIDAPTGRGHPKLRVRLNGHKFSSPVPSSERGRGDHKYLVRRVERWLEEATQ